MRMIFALVVLVTLAGCQPPVGKTEGLGSLGATVGAMAAGPGSGFGGWPGVDQNGTKVRR